MSRRILTAIGIILVVALPLALGGISLELLALFIICAGAYEWVHITPRYPQWPIIVIPVMVLSVVVNRYITDKHLFVLIAVTTIFFWTLTIFAKDFDISDAFYCLTYFLIFSLIYRTMGWLEDNHLYLVTIVFATYASDTGAWFIGSRIGRHKMNPRLSPKKSWEGFFGGWIVGTVLSIVCTLPFIQYMNTSFAIALCLFCPFVSEIGDLSFSAIKRYFNVKDFSNLLPGHGGVLDRVDSLLMNILFCGILMGIFM